MNDAVEKAFEEAWEEYGNERPEDRVLRRTARFFFYAGAEAGASKIVKIFSEEKEVAPNA